MHMWLEDQADRRPEEVVSCQNNYIHTTCEEGGLQNAKSLIAWSDSSGGQNKNNYFMYVWYYRMHGKKVFDSI